jgi:HD-like signal output (HDOD) protein
MIRVLFVDDEAPVLEAMKRAMHRMRGEWTMEFRTSGAAALQALETFPADVVVSDMRMPGMDGWELLAQVKKLYPQTARLVLSGYSDPGAIMRLVGTAHQYMAKPGESETLKTAIAQTQVLKTLLSNQELARVMGSVGTLPSFPQAFQDISNCLRRPNASISDAAAIIARDVGMTANVMKLVNSAYFGARQSIASVDRAVAYLGLDTLVALVIGHSLFQSGGVADTARLERLWLHSQRTAMTARTIALHERLPRTRVEEAFLTGMLHDVGKIVLAQGNGADLATTLDQRHAEAGAYLLGLWGFPSHIVAAIALHHVPSKRADSGLDLTVLTHIADRLVQAEAAGPAASKDLGIEPGLLEGLGLLDHLPQWSSAMVGAEKKCGSNP